MRDKIYVCGYVCVSVSLSVSVPVCVLCMHRAQMEEMRRSR